jgi:hypothetical protein
MLPTIAACVTLPAAAAKSNDGAARTDAPTSNTGMAVLPYRSIERQSRLACPPRLICSPTRMPMPADGSTSRYSGPPKCDTPAPIPNVPMCMAPAIDADDSSDNPKRPGCHTAAAESRTSVSSAGFLIAAHRSPGKATPAPPIENERAPASRISPPLKAECDKVSRHKRRLATALPYHFVFSILF